MLRSIVFFCLFSIFITPYRSAITSFYISFLKTKTFPHRSYWSFFIYPHKQSKYLPAHTHTPAQARTQHTFRSANCLAPASTTSLFISICLLRRTSTAFLLCTLDVCEPVCVCVFALLIRFASAFVSASANVLQMQFCD